MNGSPALPAAAPRWRALGDVHVAVPPGPSHRSFGFSVGGVLCAIALFSVWRRHGLRAEILGSISGLLVVAALVRPASLTPLARVWGRIGQALGWFNSRVLLTVLFFVVLTPIGFISGLFGSDPLDRRRRGGSFWKPYSTRPADSKHYERLY
jgi:hypothetical protein